MNRNSYTSPATLGAARRVVCAAVVTCLGLLPAGAAARPRLESVCTVAGQEEQRVIGLGLVVGLKGTGDGGRYAPMINALGAALAQLNNPASGPGDLKDVSNVALVLVEATLPAGGIRRGQRLDCHVNSIGSAKSLRGGRLMVTPLGSEIVDDTRVMGIASGSVSIEDPQTPTSGRVHNGLTVTADIVCNFLEGNRFTLLLDRDHASFRSASEIARVVNSDISFEAGGQQLARAVGPGVVQVVIPEQYRGDPVQFVAQVLDIGIDNPHTQARVVVNSKTGTVIVTGEVEISPVVISHKNMSVTIGPPEEAPPAEAPEPVPGVGFVPLVDYQARQSPQRLKALVDALNQLKVPTTDVIEILKDLHRTGKLHALLITE